MRPHVHLSLGILIAELVIAVVRAPELLFVVTPLSMLAPALFFLRRHLRRP